MRTLSLALFALMAALAFAPFGPAALASDDDPLFVNLITDDAHRAQMALVFTSKQQARKHPVAIFLNDKGVKLASKANAETYGEHQKLIAEIIKAGGTVLICPMCMKHYGVAEADLVEGVTLSNPERVGAELFKDDVRTLTW